MKTRFPFLATAMSLLLSFQMTGQEKTDSTHTAGKAQTKRILMVVTSASETKNGKPIGLWLEEFTTPYYYFIDQGIEVTVASPLGGKAPVDPRSTQAENSSSASVKRFITDERAKEQLNHTISLKEADAKNFDAVFYPGGHGPMWDLADNSISVKLIEAFYAAGKPIALVCHGPVALKNVKTKEGRSILKGRHVTGYSNSEEKSKETTALAPFLLEDMLKAKGADYSKGEDWMAYTVTDGLLITGQNPASAEPAAVKLVTAMTTVRPNTEKR